MQEFGKTAFPTFGPSVCDERFCSISLKLSKRNIQNIPEKRPCKNSTKWPFQLSNNLLEKNKKVARTFFPNIPGKRPTKNFANQLPQLSDHLLHFLRVFRRFANPLHNGVHVTTCLFIKKSIKVRSAKWGRRTLNK